MLKTSTDYDRTCMEELQRVAGQTFAKTSIHRKRVGALIGGLAVLAAGAGVVLGLGNLWGLALCVLGALSGAWSIWYYPFTGWASCRNLGKNRQPCDFFVGKREIILTQGGKRESVPYAQCARLMEAEKHMFVFLDSGRGLILNKSNLMGGTVEDLRRLLEEKTGKTVEWFGRSGSAQRT